MIVQATRISRKGGIQYPEKALKQPEFFFAQVVFCKKQGFYKKIVGHCKRCEQVWTGKMLEQLLVPLGHKKKFDRECIAFRLLVERW